MQKYTLQIIKIIALILLFPSISFSQTNQPNPPGTVENQPYSYCVTCFGSKWVNTDAVASLDNQFSSAVLVPYLNCYQDQCYWSRYLDCHNFGFTIPATAIIRGIQMDMTGFCDMNSSVKDYEVYLRRNNLPTGTNMASPEFWSTDNKTTSYGGSSELWGLTWNALNIDSAEFGVFIKVKNYATHNSTINIDKIKITVTYELTTGIYEQSSSINPLRVYNNVSNQELEVSFEMQKENKNAELNLYDIQGKKCFSGLMSGSPGIISKEKINTSQLKSGIYLVNVYSDNKLYSTKFNLIK
jgi:hypothetical protein